MSGETMITAEKFWKFLHDNRKLLEPDTNAIRNYINDVFIAEPDRVLDVFGAPNVVDDIIIYAVMHFLRELGARCYVSGSQIPCVLTMASLSERFVPALFEHNLKRMYTATMMEEEDEGKFSYNLASMMIDHHQTVQAQRGYLHAIGRASKDRKNQFPPDRPFTPSEAEIDSIFSRVATFPTETSTKEGPSEDVPIGSSILLLSIANGFRVVPELMDDMRQFYSTRRFSTRNNFRRPVHRIMESSRFTVISRAITPYIFAACCTLLRNISKKFRNVRIDLGAQTNPPTRLIEGPTIEVENEFSTAMATGGQGHVRVFISLGDTLMFHTSGLHSDKTMADDRILSCFVNLAHTWFALPRDVPSSSMMKLTGLRKKTSITEAAVDRLNQRKEIFFTILFATIHALMPTEEMMEMEKKLVYQNIFRHVMLSIPGSGGGGGESSANLMGKEAFNTLFSMDRIESISDSKMFERRSTLFLSRDIKDVFFMKDSRTSAAALDEVEARRMEMAMLKTIDDRPNLSPTILSLDAPAGLDLSSTPLILSPTLRDSLDVLRASGFPFSQVLSLEDVEFAIDEEPFATPLPRALPKDRPPETQQEILENLATNIPEILDLLQRVFDLTPEEIVTLVNAGYLRPEDKEQMAEIERLALVVEDAKKELEQEKHKTALLNQFLREEEQKMADKDKQLSRVNSQLEDAKDEKNRLEEIIMGKEIDMEAMQESMDRLQQEMETLKARGEGVSGMEKEKEALEQRLESCQYDLDLATADLNEAKEDQLKLWILRTVLEHMNSIEGNSSLSVLIDEDGLGDLYRYSKALNVRPQDIPEQMESAGFTSTRVSEAAFEAADKVRPEYWLSEEKNDEAKRMERRAREEMMEEATAVGTKTLLSLTKDIKDLFKLSAIRAQAKDLEECKGIFGERLRPQTSLSRALEKTDSMPGFSVNTLGMKMGSSTRKRLQVCLEEEDTPTLLSQKHHVVSTKAFCDSVLFPRPRVEVLEGQQLGLETLVDSRLGIFARKTHCSLLMDALKGQEQSEDVPVKEAEKEASMEVSCEFEEKLPTIGDDEEEEEEEEDTIPLPFIDSKKAIDETVSQPLDEEEEAQPLVSGQTSLPMMENPPVSAPDVQEHFSEKETSLEDEDTLVSGYQESDDSQDYYYYVVEETEDGLGPYSEGGYYYPSEEHYEDAVWPTQSIHSQAIPSNRRYGVLHYGKSPLFPPKTPLVKKEDRHDAYPRFRGFPEKPWVAKQTDAFRNQASAAITMLVAGTLAIASTRIYQETHSWGKKGKKMFGKDDESLKQLTMPKKFDDSCRRANKESETIPRSEGMILEEWDKLMALNAYKPLSSCSRDGKRKQLLQLVRTLSEAIETGRSERARESMLGLCDLVSFSKNVKVTMINLVREMHVATSRFRCTNNRNEMMECVRRANAIKI